MSKGAIHYYPYRNQYGKMGLVSQNIKTSEFKSGLSKHNKIWKDSRGNILGRMTITLQVFDKTNPEIIGIVYNFEEEIEWK